MVFATDTEEIGVYLQRPRLPLETILVLTLIQIL